MKFLNALTAVGIEGTTQNDSLPFRSMLQGGPETNGIGILTFPHEDRCHAWLPCSHGSIHKMELGLARLKKLTQHIVRCDVLRRRSRIRLGESFR